MHEHDAGEMLALPLDGGRPIEIPIPVSQSSQVHPVASFAGQHTVDDILEVLIGGC